MYEPRIEAVPESLGTTLSASSEKGQAGLPVPGANVCTRKDADVACHTAFYGLYNRKGRKGLRSHCTVVPWLVVTKKKVRHSVAVHTPTST